MTHLFVVNQEDGKYWATCTCGWESLNYSNLWFADLAGRGHLNDHK